MSGTPKLFQLTATETKRFVTGEVHNLTKRVRVDPKISMGDSRQMAGITDFETVAREYRPYLYNFLYAMCGDRFDADDLVQDTLVRAYEKRDTFRGESSVRTWLTRIAINTLASSRRRATCPGALSGGPGLTGPPWCVV